jgi:hypothetical protein
MAPQALYVCIEEAALLYLLTVPGREIEELKCEFSVRRREAINLLRGVESPRTAKIIP